MAQDGDSMLTLDKFPLNGIAAVGTKDTQNIWQGPLPEDVIFEIMDIYLFPELVDLLALSSTCRSMYHCSMPFRYRRVALNSNLSVEDSGKASRLETFTRTLFQKPDVAAYVRELTIFGDGYVEDEQVWLIGTTEEDCLRNTLNHSFPNLKTLAISLPIQWDSLPKSIQDACLAALTHSSLEHVQLNLRDGPSEIFGRLSAVPSIELRGSFAVSPQLEGPSGVSTMACTPKRLEIWDTELIWGRSVTVDIFQSDTALQLTSLEYFKVITTGKRLPFLQTPLALCRNTLTHLEIHHAWCPDPLSLGSLPHLETLILSADIRTLPYAGSAQVGPRNFPWLVSALRSLIDDGGVCPVRRITFLLRVLSFWIITSPRMAWNSLDTLFQPQERHLKWPNLESFRVHAVNEDPVNGGLLLNPEKRKSLQEYFCTCLPTLAKAGVLKLDVSLEKLEVWNPRRTPDWKFG